MENVGIILETCCNIVLYRKDGKPHKTRNFKFKKNYKGDGTLLEDDFSGEIPVVKRMRIGWLGPSCPGPAAGRMN